MSDAEDKTWFESKLKKQEEDLAKGVPTSFEDYGDGFFSNGKLTKWKNCSNTLMINEDSLRRTLEVIRGSSFAIFTAYKKTSKTGKVFTKEENILRNRKLRAFLNRNEMGVHQLVGHYNEIQPDGSSIPVVERSYLVEKPEYMSDKDFAYIVAGCLTIDGETQNTALMKFKSKPDKYWLMDKNLVFTLIGTKLSVDKIGDVYSQHVRKMKVPFIFEGEEIPSGMYGCLGYKKSGYSWNGHNGFGY